MCQRRGYFVPRGARICQLLLLPTEEIDFELTHVRSTGRTHGAVEVKVVGLDVWRIVAPPRIAKAIIIKVPSSKRLIYCNWREVTIDLTDRSRILRLMEAWIPQL